MEETSLPDGFVFLDEICPDARQCLRYSTTENFIGKLIAGYGGERAIMTRPAAEALAQVQSRVAADGFCLLIYDTYRPQKAVDHFAEWSLDLSDTLKQDEYYPHIDKSKVFDLGYVAKRSGHSRGSTVDLTLLPLSSRNASLSPPTAEQRQFVISDVESISLPYLNDHSVDMGTSFDLMDKASHYACNFIPQKAQENRLYLREVMIDAGFRPYDEEWWHFTFAAEPFPDTYFDFDIPM